MIELVRIDHRLLIVERAKEHIVLCTDLANGAAQDEAEEF